MDNKKTLNKSVALILAVLFCLNVFSGFAPVYGSETNNILKPCTGTEHYVTVLNFPRSGDPNKTNWGHVHMDFANEWSKGASSHTTFRVMDDHLLPDGKPQIGYCIEPGKSQYSTDPYNEFDEFYWENYEPRNGGLLEKKQVCKMLGRLMYFGYQGTIGNNWKSTNTEQADKLAWAYATQLLIWEVIVGERDIDFNHVSHRTATTVPAPPTPEPTPSPTPKPTPKPPPKPTPTPMPNSIDPPIEPHSPNKSFRQESSSTAAETPEPTPEPAQEKEPQSGILANPIYDVIDLVYSQHPLRNEILTHYTEMVTAMQNHLEKPSFMSKNISEAPTQTLEWDSAAGRYQAVLTDENNVLGNFTFQAYNPDNTVNTDVHCDISGNTLTVWSSVLITGTVAIEADRVNSHRLGVITWDGGDPQKTITFGQEIDDPVQGFLNINAVPGVGSVKIIKTSEDGNVSGITFAVAGGSVNETVTTDTNGEILIPNLLPGTYTVTEQTPDEYEPQQPQTVTVTAGEIATVTFHNILRRGSLKIIKTSEDGNVSGITFAVTGENINETVRTDANGEILIPDLLPGTYTVTEQTPDEYEPQQPQTVTVTAGEVATVTFHNVLKRGSLKIIKTSEDGNVANITFTVTGEGINETVTTNANGEILIPDLLPGTYTVTEYTPEVYEQQQSQTVTVTANETATVTFYNVLKRGSLKIIKTSEDGNVSYIGFIIAGGNVNETVTTDANGEILIPNLLPGTYTVTEQTPDEYEPQQPQTVTIVAGKTATVTFNNVLQRGSLKIIKTSEDGNVSGIGFIVAGGDVYETVTTDANGEILIPNLLPGTYTVTELTHARYEPQQPKTVTVLAGEIATVTFHNILKRGTLKIIKTSEDGNVSGIAFIVTGNNMEAVTVTTGADGIIEIPDLLPGVYTVTEVVPAGYEQQQPQTVTVVADETATVTFHNMLTTVPICGIKIIKTSEDGNVEGISFTVKPKQGKTKTVTTGANGTIEIPDLSPGTYTITETVPREYEPQQPQTVTVAAGEVAVVTFHNVLRRGTLKIIKTSEDGNVANIAFIVTGNNMEAVTVITGRDGIIEVPDLLPGVYTVTEIVPAGYEPQQSQTVIVVAGEVAVVTFHNVLQRGTLKIIKTSEDGNVEGISFTVEPPNNGRGMTVITDANGEILIPNLLPGTYTVTETVPAGYESQLPQTVTVTANETAIVTFHNVLKRGTLKIIKTSEDGNVANIAFIVTGNNMNAVTVITGRDGIIEIPDLLPGEYTVTELTPNMYEPQQPKTVTVVADQTATVTFHNVLKRGSLKIIKTSEDGNVANITFTVTGENVNETVTTDANGEILIPNLLPGTYTVTETVPAGYKPQQPKTVTVTANETATVTFHNVLQRGTLKIIKTSEDGNVEGISFTVKRNNGKAMTVTTGADGIIEIPDLLPGEYTVTELTPNMYEPQQPKTVTVVADQTATVTFHNVLKRGSLKIVKTSEDGNVANITFTVTGENVNETVTTDANGEILIPNLLPGTYTVTETVPAGYKPQQPKTVTVTAGYIHTVTFHNVLKRGKLKIIKTSEDGNVSGITFTVTGENVNETVTTDANGEILIPNLLPGTYTVTETVPAGYKPQQPKTVTVTAGYIHTVTFHNVLKRGSLKIIKTSENGKISGIEFEITGVTNCGIAFEPITVTTGSNGTVLVTNLLPGVYTVHEIVPEGYIPQPDQTVTVIAANGKMQPKGASPQSIKPLNTTLPNVKTRANSFPLLYCRESDTRSAFCASQNGAFFYKEKRKNKN